jgi:myo-inositol-1(or 4)-monophosphatase
MLIGDELGELRAFAESIAVRAGDEALAGRRRLGIGQPVVHDTKSSPTDPVTEYDRAAERLIVDAIRQARPDDAIVGEEGATQAGTSGLRWLVDPIDGTANFVYDLSHWCTSVAVVDDEGPLAGAVYAPVLGELFSAARGGGATLNGAAISCSEVDDLSSALVATGFSYSADRRAVQGDRVARLVREVRDIRRLGSAAIDLCLVACGRVDAYFEEHLNAWDLAAGILIAAEAGAITSDFAGGPAAPAATVAAGSGIHSRLLDLIAGLDA